MRPTLLARVLALSIAVAGLARAADAPPSVVDRTAVRYVTPETGGARRPRFISLRLQSLMTRIEAALERSPDDRDPRFSRMALERLVAEDMLAALLMRRGVDPAAPSSAFAQQSLADLVLGAREDLCDRLGGCKALEALMARDGIEEAELTAVLAVRSRAALYVDRVLLPILRPSEEELRESFRTAQHPYKDAKFDAARAPFTRWLSHEKLRLAEAEFFQAARTHVKIVVVPTSATPPPPAGP